MTSPQDAKPLEVYSIEFMVDNNQLGFLGKLCGVLRTPVWNHLKENVPANLLFLFHSVSDRDKNLYVYMYLPEGTWTSLQQRHDAAHLLDLLDLLSVWSLEPF